jgi:hypothetical protein
MPLNENQALGDVRPNWKQKPGMPDNWNARSAWEK